VQRDALPAGQRVSAGRRGRERPRELKFAARVGRYEKLTGKTQQAIVGDNKRMVLRRSVVRSRRPKRTGDFSQRAPRWAGTSARTEVRGSLTSVSEDCASRHGLLFTCIGRRVQLLQAFRDAAGSLGIQLEIHGTDASVLSPGIHLVDKPHLVPPIAAENYIDALLDIVVRHGIELLIPLLDFELPLIAAAAERFNDAGCRALISTESVVKTCRDKLATFKTLQSAGIDMPQTWLWSEVAQGEHHQFPYYLKPRHGSAAKGNYVIHNGEELRALGRRVPDALIQEFVSGAEHTLDVYCGFDGRPRCVVPRKRLEIRTGEVSKSLIVKDADLMAVGRRVAEVLGGCRGVVTVQCMVTPEGRIRVIEINPRFGGGVPLAIHAGADFPRWILMELLGRKPRINPTGFRDDIVMLRFDHAVFVPNASKLARAKRLTNRAPRSGKR